MLGGARRADGRPRRPQPLEQLAREEQCAFARNGRRGLVLHHSYANSTLVLHRLAMV